MIDGRPLVAVVGDVGLDVVALSRAPMAIGSDTPADVRVTPGGAGANTAAWLVACGAAATLIGRVGSDDPARLVWAELERAGVQAQLAVDETLPTCCVVVLVDELGRRSMFPSRGASGALAADDVTSADLAGVDHLHLSGYVLLDASSRAAGLAALATARAAGITTSVDPQAAALLANPAQFLADVRGVDLLLPNVDELAALTGRSAVDRADGTAVAAARQLLGYVGAVAFTAGEHGATWVDAAATVAMPAPTATVIDPTGAGDAFDAGLLAAWLVGAPVADALAAGVRAGTAAVTTIGARPGRLRPWPEPR